MALATAMPMLARRAFATLCIGLFSLTALHAQSSRVVELNDAAWKALHDGYSDKAASLFAEALTLRPNEPVLLMGAGAAAHERGNQKEAIARLSRALELNPRLTAASKMLGRIAFDEGAEACAGRCRVGEWTVFAAEGR